MEIYQIHICNPILDWHGDRSVGDIQVSHHGKVRATRVDVSTLFKQVNNIFEVIQNQQIHAKCWYIDKTPWDQPSPSQKRAIKVLMTRTKLLHLAWDTRTMGRAQAHFSPCLNSGHQICNTGEIEKIPNDRIAFGTRRVYVLGSGEPQIKTNWY